MSKNTLSAIEPIPGDNRLTTFPVSRQSIFDMYVTATRCFWVPTEIDFSKDPIDYETSPKMTEHMRHFINYVMAFFASLDKLVNVNIVERFKADFGIYEVDLFYDFQVAMENIHGHTYSLQIETIVRDAAKRQELIDSVHTIPVIGRMAEWIKQCVASDEGIGARLLRMVAVEGIFFIGAFCAIYWIGEFGIMPGLVHANELIQRDETLHTLFALHLYTLLRPEHKLSDEEIYTIMREAMDVAWQFVKEAIPMDMPSMNQRLMMQYLECQVDNLLTVIDVPPMYGSTNPFGFMEKINMPNRTNFFEKRVSEYSRAVSSSSGFEVADDF